MAELTVTTVDASAAPPYRELERQGIPVLITGLLDDWAALDRWDQHYLRETVGEVTAPVEFYPSGTYFGPWTHIEMRVARYLDLITGPEPQRCYLAQVPLVDKFPALVPDLSVPLPLREARALGAALFVGRDTVTAMHYHSTDQALLCGVTGTKQVVLHPPRLHGRFSYEPFYSYRFNFSRTTFGLDGDRRTAPDVPTYRCEVLPGHALFIPLYWGHLVEGHGFTTSVTFFWNATVSGWHHPRMKVIATAGRLSRHLVATPAGMLARALRLTDAR